ncbi:xaa-Pro aminopeptidase 3-like isoform X2 [Leptopilina boulardi]|uniref:xaa-Pro aminopeptidase 3-like isoform X2 n=1 Tax=Leptopilina boulardi TaxID=63433 RepID=UPI0021F5CB9F|nr:xaa-Pro aminopeptidase 3-like isoform X2 [Leptopilina boulardi]
MFYQFRRVLKYPLNSIGSHLSKYSTKVVENTSSICDQQRIIQTSFGQPTYQTHPHLIKKGEIIPGIQLEEFKTRRSKLMEQILLNDKLTHIVIIPSSTTLYMTEKIPYVYRQNSDFLYFTGCQEPDSCLIITGNCDNFTSTLFMRNKDPKSELWNGTRTGVDAAVSLFGVDDALPVDDFEKFLTSFINENRNNLIWYNTEDIVQPELDEKLRRSLKIIDNKLFHCPKTMFHQLRLIKSKAEINLMQKSCDIASLAISKAINLSKPGISEHELFAIVDYESRMNGAEFLAYPPVVAGGKNACTIHYITNNQIVKDGDMILMDAGCEYHGYSSDITRTWPVNGTFSPQQRILYEIILETQKEMILKLNNMPSLEKLFREMCLFLGKRLQEIGLVPKNFGGDKLIAAGYTYCPHHVSHYLGMDVHDTAKISRNIKVQPGMIVTVEPGIYVSPKNQFALPEFYNLGIRIEDDVLIQEEGTLVLTRNCPKEIKEIENFAKQNQSIRKKMSRHCIFS